VASLLSRVFVKKFSSLCDANYVLSRLKLGHSREAALNSGTTLNMWLDDSGIHPGQLSARELLCARLIVEATGLVCCRCGSCEGFDLFLICDVKQLLPAFWKLGPGFLEGPLG
jgi:hypothetical protein